MSIKLIQRKLNKLYGGRVTIEENDYSFILSGRLDNYEDVLNACYLAVNRKSGKHVVNNIEYPRQEEKIHAPSIVNKELDGKQVDVLVIGGGISGCSILRELSKYNLKTLLIEKENDVANQASGRNDGQIHPGVDLKKGLIKQSYVVKGNRMYDQVSKELGVPFKRVGQHACFKQVLLFPIICLYAFHRKYFCGIDDTKIVFKKEIKRLYPYISDEVKYGMGNSSTGVISPYNLTIAYAENAIENGAEVSLDTICLGMEMDGNRIIKVKTNKGDIYPKLVINAAGVFADNIAEMANDRFYSIHPRKGTIVITDKKENILNEHITSIKILGKKSMDNKHSKGGGVIRTVHDNLLVGPDAIETYLKEDISTSVSSINHIYNKQVQTFPKLSKQNIITYFAGVRACTFEEDYVIEKGHNAKNMIHVAGIQSPGLTTAPAVALDIEKMAVEMLSESMKVEKNPSFNPYRNKPVCLSELTEEEKDKLIKENPAYGEIVCRCEEISKGEIIDAINRPLKVATIDGVKRRVRPGMGRCQGSFCMPIVTKIIAENEKKEIKDVTKQGKNAFLFYRNTKEDN